MNILSCSELLRLLLMTSRYLPWEKSNSRMKHFPKTCKTTFPVTENHLLDFITLMTMFLFQYFSWKFCKNKPRRIFSISDVIEIYHRKIPWKILCLRSGRFVSVEFYPVYKRITSRNDISRSSVLYSKFLWRLCIGNKHDKRSTYSTTCLHRWNKYKLISINKIK